MAMRTCDEAELAAVPCEDDEVLVVGVDVVSSTTQLVAGASSLFVLVVSLTTVTLGFVTL
jgi:hypothetical protein